MAGAGLSHRDSFAGRPGHVIDARNDSRACDHPTHRPQDLDLDPVRDAGFDADRLSTLRARAMPDGVTVKPDGLDVCDRLVDGMHAPGLRDIRAASRAMHHALLVHGTAMQADGADIPGIGLKFETAHPADAPPKAARAAGTQNAICHPRFIRALMGQGALQSLGPHPPQGWEDDMAPEAGDASGGDLTNEARRIALARDHLRATKAAMDQGVDVQGIFDWSLLNNSEWGGGYGPRFGLVHVDDDTMTLTSKSSWHAFRAMLTGQRAPVHAVGSAVGSVQAGGSGAPARRWSSSHRLADARRRPSRNATRPGED